MEKFNEDIHVLLERAIVHEKLEELQWILPLIDINVHIQNFQTPLHFAVLCQARSTVKFLLKNGASPIVRNSNGATPLHIAAAKQYPELAKLLIDAGADIAARDCYGRTPLYVATQVQSFELVCLFLYHNADPNIPDFYNVTPFMLSLKCLETGEIAALLLMYVIDLNAKCMAGVSILQRAIHACHPLAPVIVEKGAEIVITNPECYSLVLITLRQEQPIAFQKVFPYLRYDPLYYKNLFRYFLYCFKRTDFEECLLVFLNSKDASKFIDENNIVWKRTYERLCTEMMLFMRVHDRNYEFRMSILRRMLSMGMKLYWGDYVSVHKLYSFNGELKLMIQYPISSDCEYGNYIVNSSHTLTVDPKFLTADNIKFSLERSCQLFLNSNLSVAIQLNKLLYLDIFFEVRPLLSKMNQKQIAEEIIAKFGEKSSVPTLLELGQNRVLVVEAGNSKSATELFNRLEKLEIPMKCRKALILKALFMLTSVLMYHLQN